MLLSSVIYQNQGTRSFLYFNVLNGATDICLGITSFFCGGVIIVLKVLLLSYMVTVMIREFSHFEKKKTFLSLCVNKITLKMTLYHIELILNYKHLQEKTQKQRLHCICKKSKYLLNRFPFIHSCSEIVYLKRKNHHELCFIKHGMNVNFSKKIC